MKKFISEPLRWLEYELVAPELLIISDIHANAPALCSVLNQVSSDVPVVCAGDILGYHIDTNLVCELLRARQVYCILGNHDKYVIGSLAYDEAREERYRIKKSREELSAENFCWLKELPDGIRFHVKDKCGENYFQFDMVHGSLRDIEEYVYPDSDLEPLLSAQSSYLILGHTHHPMLREAGARKIINPGSVGQARDRKPGASFALFDVGAKKVNFSRAHYDAKSYAAVLKKNGVCSLVVELLLRTS
jgi:putative phosphoesterase